MSRPYVSVLIDTYNHERFIADAVSSVLSQDLAASEREVVVVDDGSTDRTTEILRGFEPEVRVLRKRNGGQASAFNCGIPECGGQLVAFLDGDDWWAPAKLSAVVEAFANNPDVGLIGHSIIEVLSDGKQWTEMVRDAERFRVDSIADAKIFRMRKSFLGTSRMAYRSELLRRIGQVPETLTVEADEFLFTLGAVFSEVLLLREPFTFYRLHGQNLFQTSALPAVRRKHTVLVALAEALNRRLEQERVPPAVARTVVESIEIEADALRASLGEGLPWETFRAELRTYKQHHENASGLRYALKFVSAVPALFLPPRTYNSFKNSIASHSLYRSIRNKFFPFHDPGHVDRSENWKAR